MSKWILALVLLTGLTASATADPITLSTLQLAQAVPGQPTAITIAPVGDGTLPTFTSLSQDFTLFATITPRMELDGTFAVVAPLAVQQYTFPAATDTLVTSVRIPRVYRPTVFSAEAVLYSAAGERLDARTFQWVASSPVPEPATWGLVGLGLVGVLLVRRNDGLGRRQL